MNRFYYPGAMKVGQTVELSGEEFHHAVRVHRGRAGEEIELFDGRGSGYRGRILSERPAHRSSFSIRSHLANRTSSSPLPWR